MMTDLELTKLCAQAMGYKVVYSFVNGAAQCEQREQPWFSFSPLTDDTQAMALVKKLGLEIEPSADGKGVWFVRHRGHQTFFHLDLNRAIVECVARLTEKEAG